MKEIEWSPIYGEGTIVCTCDQCPNTGEHEFEDNHPDYGKFQNELFDNGWKAVQIEGEWHDFCCEECRNRYIKNNT